MGDLNDCVSLTPIPVGNIEVVNHVDRDGNPSGGTIEGVGLYIRWQSGPTRKERPNQVPIYERNGAFVEDVLIAAQSRLEFYQRSEYKCSENAYAIQAIDTALKALAERRANRVARDVYGKNEK